jgi:hypothetical protein
VSRAPLCGLHGSDEPAYFALHAFRLDSELIGERFDLVADVGVAQAAPMARNPITGTIPSAMMRARTRQFGNGLESPEK